MKKRDGNNTRPRGTVFSRAAGDVLNIRSVQFQNGESVDNDNIVICIPLYDWEIYVCISTCRCINWRCFSRVHTHFSCFNAAGHTFPLCQAVSATSEMIYKHLGLSFAIVCKYISGTLGVNIVMITTVCFHLSVRVFVCLYVSIGYNSENKRVGLKHWAKGKSQKSNPYNLKEIRITFWIWDLRKLAYHLTKSMQF